MTTTVGRVTEAGAASYPQDWEADVVLKDGGTCHLRPIRPADADGLRRFHGRLSPETIYFRFFAPYPALTDRDVQRFTLVDYVDRVALVATIGDEIVGVVRYDRIQPHEAEVAFVIRDDQQGRGLGTIFLEHIAQAARERGVKQFVAEVLPDNGRMLEIFRQAGYNSSSSIDDGVVHLSFSIEPSASSLAVTRAREHRAESVSVQRLLTPRSVAVVGASRDPNSVGNALVRHLVEGGFTGRVIPVNPTAGEIAGVPAVSSLREVGTADLVIVAVPAAAVIDVVEQAADVGAHGVVVVSAGFAETGPAGLDLQRELVRRARANGMRVIGPNALGVLNTDPAVSLNASLSPVMPGRGTIGFFSQSGAMGAALLESLVTRGLGVTTFVSAGNRADLSGNDLMQYWEEDDATDVVLLYLESIGNPRKFSRIARRMGRRKPVVAVKTGRSSQGIPLGHTVRSTSLPQAAVDEMFEQSGVIRTDTLAQMFDIAQLVAFQPLPQGRRVLAMGNSDAMAVMAADAIAANGLQLVDQPLHFASGATAQDFERALAAAVDDPAVDSVVTLFVPPLNASGESVARALARVAGRATKPIVSVMFAVEGVHDLLRQVSSDGVAVMGTVPTYAAVEDAVRALGAVTHYAQWRHRAVGHPVDLDDVDGARASELIQEWLSDVTADDTVDLTGSQAAELVSCYGIDVWPSRLAASADDAVAAAEQLGYPVVLKTEGSLLRMRSDLGGIYFDLGDESAVRREFAVRAEELRAYGIEGLLVQRQAEPGVATVVESSEDALFGPVVSFGVAGIATDLLADRGFRIPPLTDVDVDDLMRSPRASPLLFGAEGNDPVDVASLRDLLARVAQLSDDLPEVRSMVLRPVVVSPTGTAVLGVRVRLAHPLSRTDRAARRLLG